MYWFIRRENEKDVDFIANKKKRGPFCPSCKRFVWHTSCGEKIFRDFSMDIPDWESGIWECPHC